MGAQHGHRIARAAGDIARADILEIGPGPGGLTRGLLAEGARRVVAVEKDARCLPALEQIAAAWPGRLAVVHGDALDIDPGATLAPPVKIVANLPYNVSTPLLFHLIEQRAAIADMHFMLQREVVDRIVAAPGSGTYGRLSVMIQAYCDAQSLFRVAPGAFRPPPKVESASTRVHVRRH